MHRMTRHEIADALLVAALAAEALGTRLGADVCLEAAKEVERGNPLYMRHLYRTRLRWSRASFRRAAEMNAEHGHHLSWPLLDARIQGYCALMLRAAFDLA